MTLDYIPDTITEEAFFEKVYAKTKSERALTTMSLELQQQDSLTA